MLPFQICPRVCLLLMCLPQPRDSPSAFPGLSCGLSFGFFAPFRSWASYDNGFYISLAHFWFSSLHATLNCYSYRNDLILLDPFLGQPFIPFLSGLSRALFCFYSWAPMSLWASLRASTARLLSLGFLGLFANSTLPWAFLLTSLDFPGPITLSLFLGFMSLP